MWKFVDEQHAVGLEVDRGQDEEAPHREEVGEAGDRPFQQPGLPEHLFELGGDASAEVVLAAALVAGFLAGPDQVRQPQHAAGGEDQHNRGHPEPDDEPDQRMGVHPRASRCLSYPRVTYLKLLAGNLCSMPAHSCISPGKAATKADLTYDCGDRTGSKNRCHEAGLCRGSPPIVPGSLVLGGTIARTSPH